MPAEDNSAPGPEQHDATEQAMQGLIDNSRILIEAKMIATEGTLPADQIERVVTAFQRYIEKYKGDGLSLKQVAREINYSPAVLSEWTRRRYAGDVSTVTRAVSQFMERDARRRDAKRPTDFISTIVADQMGAIIQLADKTNMMAAIVAPSGVGKTRVLRHFGEQYNGILITCVPGMVAKHLYRALAEELGWRSVKGTRFELLQYCVSKLAGTRRMLMLDEAHLLGNQIGCVRPIYDLAGVVVIMAGAAEILAAIDEDRSHGNGQMSSRTIRFDCLKGMGRGERSPSRRAAVLLYSKDDITRFFAMKRMRLTRDGLDCFHALANIPGEGSLRLLMGVAGAIVNSNPDIKAIGRSEIVAMLALVAGERASVLLRACDETMETAPDAGLARVG